MGNGSSEVFHSKGVQQRGLIALSSHKDDLVVLSRHHLECYSPDSLKKTKTMALEHRVVHSCLNQGVLFILMSDQSIRQFYLSQKLFQGTIKDIHFDRQGLKVQGTMCYVKSSEHVEMNKIHFLDHG